MCVEGVIYIYININSNISYTVVINRMNKDKY